MSYSTIIEAIDAELSRLQEARKLLENTTDVLSEVAVRRGRPKGVPNKPKAEPVKAKRGMSDEGKARIAEAQRKRHALKKREAKKAAKEAAQTPAE